MLTLQFHTRRPSQTRVLANLLTLESLSERSPKSLSLSLAAVLTAALFVVPGQAEAAGLPITTAQEIVAGTKSCVAATSAAGVNAARLQADGWRRAVVSSNSTGTQNSGVSFARRGLLLTLSGGSRKVCNIIARVDAAAIANIVPAMGRGLGTAGNKSRAGEADTAYWFPAGHIVRMQLTGKPDARAIRIAVGYAPVRNK